MVLSCDRTVLCRNGIRLSKMVVRIHEISMGVVRYNSGLSWLPHTSLYTNIQSELAPMEDRNQFHLQLSAVEGTSYDYMDNFVQTMVQFVQDSVPEYKTALSVTAPGFTGSGSVNMGFVRVTLSRSQ